MMGTVTKKQMIEELTYYELEYLVNNHDEHLIQEVADFFAKGGFSVYPDHMLKNKYDKFIGCGVLK